MRIGKEPKSKSLVVLEENIKAQYLNEFTTESEYRKLTKNEKVINLSEYAATEYLNTTKVIDAIFNNKKKSDTVFNDLEMKLSGTEFFKDVDRSTGDITRTKNHNNLKNLLHYGMDCNANNSYRSNETAAFDKNALVILTCMNLFAKNATKFKKLINHEATNLNSKKVATSFYKASVFLIQMTGDILYSNSIDAKFNYNIKPPVAENVSFAYTSGVVDEMIEQIQAINSAFMNGKIFKAFDTTLQEDFEDTINKISLNEDVLDTIFGLVTHFNTLDLLILFPIYLTRSTLYWIGYFYLSVKNINMDIDRSIQVTRGRNIDVDDFNMYVSDSKKKGEIVKNSFNKASATIDLDASTDKRALSDLRNSAQNSVLI